VGSGYSSSLANVSGGGGDAFAKASALLIRARATAVHALVSTRSTSADDSKILMGSPSARAHLLGFKVLGF